jgi:hypothetical protein
VILPYNIANTLDRIENTFSLNTYLTSSPSAPHNTWKWTLHIRTTTFKALPPHLLFTCRICFPSGVIMGNSFIHLSLIVLLVINISSHHCRNLRWNSCEVLKVTLSCSYIWLISNQWKSLILISIGSHLPLFGNRDTLIVVFDLSVGSIRGEKANLYVTITTVNWRP